MDLIFGAEVLGELAGAAAPAPIVTPEHVAALMELWRRQAEAVTAAPVTKGARHTHERANTFRRNGRGRMTPETVEAIKILSAEGWSARKIGRACGLSHVSARKAVKRLDAERERKP